jgi:hypothetical protein
MTLRSACYVLNLRWDVIAWNAAADDLFAFSGRGGRESGHTACSVALTVAKGGK